MRHYPGLRILYVLPLCLFPFFLTAQSLSWSGGLVLGLNVSDERHDNEVFDGSPKTGTELGMRVACGIKNRLFIQAEALIERKGSNQDLFLTDIEGNPIIETSARRHFTYLVFPLTMQWQFGNSRFRYGPYAGAYLARLVRQTFIFTNLDGSPFKEDHTELFNKSDAGAIVGFGTQWAINNAVSLDLEARYSIGLRNTQLPTVSSDRTWNRSLALLAGLRFTIGS